MKRFLVLATAAATACLSLGLAGATTAVAVGGVAANAGGPMVRVSTPHAGLPTISENWSGYAVTSNKKFNYVHSQFVEPRVTCDGDASRNTSNWVGLDGFNDQTVEQDGTGVYCAGPGNMTAYYYAWIEMYPLPEVYAFYVEPGNVIDATVTYAKGKFILTVADLSTHKSVTTSAACSTCLRASAEWIVERPAECTNAQCTAAYLTSLANFGTTSLGDDTAATAGGSVRGLSSFSNSYPIYMVQPKGKKGGFVALDSVGPVSTPSQSFSVTWIRPGRTIPITL